MRRQLIKMPMAMTNAMSTPNVTIMFRVPGSEGGGMIKGVDVGLTRFVGVGTSVGVLVMVGVGEGFGVIVGEGEGVGVERSGVGCR